MATVFESGADSIREVPEIMLMHLWNKLYDDAEQAVVRYNDKDVTVNAKYIDAEGKQRPESALTEQGILPAILHLANNIALQGKPDSLSDSEDTLYLQNEFIGISIGLDDSSLSKLAVEGSIRTAEGVANKLLYMNQAMETLIMRRNARSGVMPDITGAVNYNEQLRKNIINKQTADPVFNESMYSEYADKKAGLGV